MPKTVLLTNYQKIESIAGYQTVLNSITGKYKIVKPDGSLSDHSYSNRRAASFAALRIAKLRYIGKSWRRDPTRAQKLLGNELYEDFCVKSSYNSLQAFTNVDTKDMVYEEFED